TSGSYCDLVPKYLNRIAAANRDNRPKARLLGTCSAGGSVVLRNGNAGRRRRDAKTQRLVVARTLRPRNKCV
ncbi:MAG TPA: hypothetical protein VK137_04555, partial [Planctomycetaceae bacterium]|nr:hypothetical protein [Planctomycetaceae bacterium]